MIERNYDKVVIGKSYLSYILALNLLKQGKSVLIIDDERVRYGDSWSLHFGEIEVEYLRLLGEKLGVDALEHIDTFLRPCPTHLYVQGKRIFLGVSASETLREIARKFPDIFNIDQFKKALEDPAAFNTQFEEYFQELAEVAFNHSSFEGLTESIFSECKGGQHFKELVEVFSREYFQKANDENLWNLTHRLFVYGLHVLFQSQMGDESTEFELYYLMANLFSKRYLVDSDSLMKELEEEFFNCGGHFKKTQVQHWQFFKNKLSNILLSTYEGVVGPGEVIYMGSFTYRVPFRLRQHRRLYSALLFSIELDTPFFEGHVGQRLFYVEEERLGSDLPVWEAFFESPTKAKIKVLYPKQIGSKYNFYLEMAQELVMKRLKDLFWGLTENDLLSPLYGQETYDEWIVSEKTYKFQRRKNTFSGFDMKLLADIEGSERKVSGINYMGPLKTSSLGMFSYLMDLKDYVGERAPQQ